MKHVLIASALCLMLCSCGVSTTVPLYYWGGNTNGTTVYENLAYKTFDKQTPEVTCALLVAYENMVTNPGGSRKVPPPGICAEYGYLLLKPETAATFAEHATPAQKKVFEGVDLVSTFRERGELMMQKEIEYYPEAEKFILPLIKKFKESL